MGQGDRKLRDRFYNRVMFPIHDEQGECVAFGGFGQVAHGFRKRDVLRLHDVGKHVAALAAAKAVPQLQCGIDFARRRFLVVERAAQPEVAAALLDRRPFSHDGDQVACLAYLLDVLVADCHMRACLPNRACRQAAP